MSGLKLHISQRGWLSLFATFMLLIVMMIAAPGVSSARAAVKQFKATVDPTTALGQTSGSWTETVTNCGGTPLPATCTVSSTINLGTIQIAVPTEFRPITSVAASSPSGQTTRNWTVSYDSGTGTINGFANGGTDKLQPGESILITFGATPSTCTGTKTFTTSAWGSTPTPGSDPFTITSPPGQPTITISGCGVMSGGTVTGPGGQTETVSGGFGGHVIVTFGGNLSCSEDAQWVAGFHLPTQVNITPADDYTPGSGPKISTSTFDGTGDSSFYRICYSPDPNALTGTILPPCYPGGLADPVAPPCVDKQYRDFTTNKIVITVLVPAADPGKH
jgi:hypothetical protein